MRIEGAEPRALGFWAGLLVRFFYWMTRRKMGRVLSSVRLAAHHPRLLLGRGLMEQAVLGSHRVDMPLKTLVGLRAASLVGCVH